MARFNNAKMLQSGLFIGPRSRYTTDPRVIQAGNDFWIFVNHPWAYEQVSVDQRVGRSSLKTSASPVYSEQRRKNWFVMPFSPFDLLFNILLMLFWVRIWNPPARGLPNPYCEGIDTLTQPVLAWFRSLTGNRMSLAGTALLAWFLLILFRTAVWPNANKMFAEEGWALRFGLEVVLTGGPAGFVSWLAYSLFSFFAFLYLLWSVEILLLWRYNVRMSTDRAGDFLYRLARPFSSIHMRLQPFVLLMAGTGFLAALNLFASPAFAADGHIQSVPSLMLLRFVLASAAAFANVLSSMVSFILYLILASFVGLFANSQGMMLVCQEWLNLVLWPFGRNRLHVAVIDLTPFIASLVLVVVHFLLMNDSFGVLTLLYKGCLRMEGG